MVMINKKRIITISLSKVVIFPYIINYLILHSPRIRSKTKSKILNMRSSVDILKKKKKKKENNT